MTENYLTPTYGRSAFVADAPSENIPENSLSPREALQIIDDELDLDSRNSSDLGSYICDYMDPEADELIKRTIGKVYIDHSEYPKTSQIGDRVAKMIQRWYYGKGEALSGELLGTVTIGSSEAVMLGLITHRYNWIKAWKKRLHDPKTKKLSPYYAYDKPFGLWANDVHTCWDKYAKYYNTPELSFSLSDDNWLLDPKKVKQVLNLTLAELASSTDLDLQKFYKIIMVECHYESLPETEFKALMNLKKVGELVYVVGGVVGTTFTGQSDDISALNDILVDFKKVHLGNESSPFYADIPIHCDAASGGFVVPFSDPKFLWDFRLTQVKSINVSNHKFGLVYPGCGTVVFRDNTIVDKSLIYDITYLGGHFTDFTVNFSRGSAMVLAAYYNLIRMGLEGYKAVNMNCVKNSSYLANKITSGEVTSSIFKVISDTVKFPMVVWLDIRKDQSKWNLVDLSNELLKAGWRLPAYKLPYQNKEQPDGPLAMRVVTRQDVSQDKLNVLYNDIVSAINFLNSK